MQPTTQFLKYVPRSSWRIETLKLQTNSDLHMCLKQKSWYLNVQMDCSQYPTHYKSVSKNPTVSLVGGDSIGLVLNKCSKKGNALTLGCHWSFWHIRFQEWKGQVELGRTCRICTGANKGQVSFHSYCCRNMLLWLCEEDLNVQCESQKKTQKTAGWFTPPKKHHQFGP